MLKLLFSEEGKQVLGKVKLVKSHNIVKKVDYINSLLT